jgi:hypothetical protein
MTASQARAEYLAPPSIVSAVLQPSGAVVLTGSGQPGSRIRLASPDGSAIGATASTTGAWSLTVPPGDAPRLYSLSSDIAGRLLRARGYVATTPAPGPAAAVLAPGEGAQAFGWPAGGVTIRAIDFDSSGAAVASGGAPAGDAVRLRLDGADAGEDQADAKGDYSVSMSRSLTRGQHTIAAHTAHGSASATLDMRPGAPIAAPPLAAERVDGAWRLDWTPPGGGVQTTVLFDPPQPARDTAR